MAGYGVLGWLLALRAVAALADVGPTGPAPGGGLAVLTVPGVSRRVPAAGAPVAAAVTGLGEFAERLCGAVLQPGSNAVFSPLSIAYAFAMLRAAAGGDTAAELDEVFGFPAGGVHEAYNALSRQLVSTDAAPPLTGPEPTGPGQAPTDAPERAPAPIVAIANGLFVQAGLQPAEAFLRTLAEQYGAPPLAVDFGSDQAPQAVNRWVRQHTAGRVDHIVDGFDPETASVIANAVYLKAAWQQPFEPADTGPAPFQLADRSTVEVPTMGLTGTFGYATGPGWQAVELPYTGGELVMWLLVPDRGQRPDHLLTPGLLAAAQHRARREYLSLAMPRWDFATHLELLPVLDQLGLTNLRDLPGIDPRAYVSDAVHRANITVDEWGTEAAAVTAITVGVVSVPDVPAITVQADHPFAFAITHPATGTPLFLGQVANPTQP